jgi:hypothetical protein
LQEITMSKSRLTLFVAALASTYQPAYAADQVLEFKLVTRNIEVKMHEAKNVEGQNIGVAKAYGVAYFKDGRVASKDFVTSWDYNKGVGPFSGYSTYTFEDGSTITARFTGNARGPGQFRGDYAVLSGTGSFAGVKGTGSFETTPAKFPDASLMNGKFSLSTP